MSFTSSISIAINQIYSTSLFQYLTCNNVDQKTGLETSAKRRLLIVVVIVSVVAIATISIQLWTEVDNAQERQYRYQTIHGNILTLLDMLQLLELITIEMVAFYEYNDVPYDEFYPHAQDAIRDFNTASYENSLV